MMAMNMEGFDDVSSPKEPTENDIKKKRGIKKGGGFQAMGLSFPLLKGIQKRGYKIPTPIQRKTIPVVLQGRDIVAMARTGSGKTACFLIPLFEKLLNSAKKSGARALILSPTRELALQTLKFVKEIGRFMNLKSAVILGGDSMDNQFAAIHGNPDIIVATPGRFLHICVEMELKLQGVQYVVFDEADRLFEMGFGEQLRDIVKRLPESRQTLLFSATLPKVLVEFAKAGLSDPVLIRLDVESKLPEKLDLAFVSCRSEEKCATVLCLLKYVIPPGSQTVLFAATRHHVEYLHMILDKANIPNAYIYSSLDPSARKIGAAKFQTGKVPVLIVTDVAARGLDIPQLDFVINYNFPAKPKLFVHRVGRCARAGRSGIAYSLVSSDEFPYLLDLHLFLGRPVQLEGEGTAVVGTVPQNLLEEEQSELVIWHDSFVDLGNMKMVCSNAYKQYLRSRPGASVESVRRAKEMKLTNLKNHSIFDQENEKSEVFKNDLLNQMKRYRPVGTIFEIGRSCTSDVYTVMKAARQKHKNSIANHKRKLEDMKKVEEDIPERITLAASSTDEIRETFQDMIIPKKYNMKAVYHQKKKIKTTNIDKEHFVPYKAVDHHTEQGLQVNNFQTEANKMQLDLTADTEEALKLHRRLMHWDRKKKKMVGTEESKVPKIRTEAGTWIPTTFKTKRYAQWKERNKVDENEDASDDSGDDEGDKNSQARKVFLNKKFPNTHWGRHNEKLQQKIKSELRRPEQILKMRKEKERRKARSNRPKRKNKKKQ